MKISKDIYWRNMWWNFVVTIVSVPMAAFYILALVNFSPAEIKTFIKVLFWVATILFTFSMFTHRLFINSARKTLAILEKGDTPEDILLNKAERRILWMPYFNISQNVFLYGLGGILLAWAMKREGMSSTDAFYIFACAFTMGVVSGLGIYYTGRFVIKGELKKISNVVKEISEKPPFLIPIAGKLAVTFLLVIVLTLAFLGFFSYATTERQVAKYGGNNQVSELMAVGSLLEKAAGNDIEKLKSLLQTVSLPGKTYCVIDEMWNPVFCAGDAPSSEVLNILKNKDASEIATDRNNGWTWSWTFTANGRDKIASGWQPTDYSELSAFLRRNYVRAALVVIVFAMALSLMIALDVSLPMRELSKTAVNIAGGNTDVPLVPGGDDETGVLARAFNRMTRILIAQLKSELQRSQAMMGSIRSAIEVLAPMSQEMVIISGQQSSSSSRQAAAAEEAAATSQEIAAVAKQIAVSSTQVAQAAEGVLNMASEGEKKLELTTATFNDIIRKMKDIAESAVKLGEQSREIGNIVKIIEEISENTNLLSLNAAIEAAGAGEHGRRFGVVAQEIGRLAKSSTQSTKKIRDIIERMQNSISGAVMQAEEGEKTVSKGKTVIDEMSEFFNEVFSAASESARNMKEINLMTSQQSSASDQMALTMSEVKETAQQSAAAAEQLKASVAELEKLVLELKAHAEGANSTSHLEASSIE